MRLFIHYDRAKGKILSVVMAEVISDSLEHPFGSVEETESVLEVEPTSELSDLDCHEIYKRYVVDTKKMALKKKVGRSQIPK
jgi:hypothetical protein